MKKGPSIGDFLLDFDFNTVGKESQVIATATGVLQEAVNHRLKKSTALSTSPNFMPTTAVGQLVSGEQIS